MFWLLVINIMTNHLTILLTQKQVTLLNIQYNVYSISMGEDPCRISITGLRGQKRSRKVG